MVNEYYRSNYPLEIGMSQEDCDQKVKKHILGIYDQELYPKGDESYETRYWTTTNGAEMTLYYRDNIQLESDSLFPDQEEYILPKDELYELNNYIDFYTVTCTKPGKFSIRPHYIEFGRTTHKVEENTIETFALEPDVSDVIQLTAPIVPFKNTSEYLYFSIFSLEGKEVNIAPKQNFIIDDTTLKGDEPLLSKVKIGDYKPDQLAFNIDTEEIRTRIEVIQVVRYNNLNILVIDNDTKTKLTSNHFVRYFPKNLTRVKVKISGLNNEPVTYKLAKLSTDNVNYLSFATQLNSATEDTLNSDDDEINLINEKEDYNLKKFVGFVFSINNNVNREYNVSFDPIYEDGKKDDDQKDDDGKDDGKKEDGQAPEPKPESGGTSGSTITIIILSIIIIGLVVGIIIYCIIKRKQKSLGGGKFEELENDNNHPFAPIMDQ